MDILDGQIVPFFCASDNRALLEKVLNQAGPMSQMSHREPFFAPCFYFCTSMTSFQIL